LTVFSVPAGLGGQANFSFREDPMVITDTKFEKLEKSRVRLTLTVPAAEVRKEYDSMMKEYINSVKIDGFRKGHVPASVLERKFGESLRLDAMGRVLEKAVEEGLKASEEKPLMYDTPELDGKPEFAVDKDFTFSVLYDVYPKVEAPNTDGIEITLPKVEISEADVARELEQIRQRNAIVVEKTGPAAKGDIATVNFYEIDEDGAPVSGSAREDFTFEVGSGMNLYKFDEDVEGMAAGDEKTFTKTYPADSEYPELAGRTVKLNLKVTKVKQKDLPALDDELAQDVSEKFKTLEDLKQDLKKQLQASLDERLRNLKEQAIVAQLQERTKIEVPETMIAAELAMRWDALKRDMGIDSDEKMEKIAAYSGKTRESLYQDWRPAVEKAIAGRLLVDALIEKSGFTVSDEDVQAEYARIAEGTALSPEEVKAEYEKQNYVEHLKNEILERKFFDSVLANTAIKDGEAVSFVDFMSKNQ